MKTLKKEENRAKRLILRQITLSVNDLQISCRTSYFPSVA